MTSTIDALTNRSIKATNGGLALGDILKNEPYNQFKEIQCLE